MTGELTYQYLSEAFDLDESTGILRWKQRPDCHFADKAAAKSWNARCASKEAGHKTKTGGYIRVVLSGVDVRAHRIVFALHSGKSLSEVPECIDHIDGNPSNNRPSNLRAASSRQNSYNARAHANTVSGAKGAYFNRRNGRWYAQIMTLTGRVHLGMFNTKEEAAAAYIGAAIILHGEFFRDPREKTQAAA